jgi:hypothetical protein
MGKLSGGEAASDPSEAPVEIAVVALHEGPMLVATLSRAGIEATLVEAWNPVTDVRQALIMVAHTDAARQRVLDRQRAPGNDIDAPRRPRNSVSPQLSSSTLAFNVSIFELMRGEEQHRGEQDHHQHGGHRYRCPPSAARWRADARRGRRGPDRPVAVGHGERRGGVGLVSGRGDQASTATLNSGRNRRTRTRQGRRVRT